MSVHIQVLALWGEVHHAEAPEVIYLQSITYPFVEIYRSGNVDDNLKFIDKALPIFWLDCKQVLCNITFNRNYLGIDNFVEILLLSGNLEALAAKNIFLDPIHWLGSSFRADEDIDPLEIRDAADELLQDYLANEAGTAGH